MMDLERVLPAGVQVTSIEPVISKQGEVSIRLRVNGDRERAVQLVRNLETSQRFVAPRLASEQAQAQESGRVGNAAPISAPGAVQFDILSGYNPLPEKHLVKVEEATAGAAALGQSTPAKVRRPAKSAAPRRSASKRMVAPTSTQKAVPR
jgi:type IV pilus assembly protein PilN